MLTKTLAQRIKYVRENLIDEDGASMTQLVFAQRVGASGYHAVLRWEKHGFEPGEPFKQKIAELTEGAYSERLFSRGGAELLVVEKAVPRLQALEADADRDRALLEAVLLGLKQAGIPIPNPRQAPQSAATAPLANPARSKR